MGAAKSQQPTGKAHVYCRVSTEGQATEGVSLDMQQSRGRAWAEANGYEVADVYVDAGISGKRADNRPELQRALAALKAGDVLVFYSLSRLSRTTWDVLVLNERLSKIGVGLVSLTESIDSTTPMGRMVLTVMAAVAQLDRELTAERVRHTLRYKREQGEVYGPLPFGQDRDGDMLRENRAELDARERMLQLRADGYSLRQIATWLTDSGVAAKKGGRWQANTVRRVLAAGGAA